MGAGQRFLTSIGCIAYANYSVALRYGWGRGGRRKEWSKGEGRDVKVAKIIVTKYVNDNDPLDPPFAREKIINNNFSSVRDIKC